MTQKQVSKLKTVDSLKSSITQKNFRLIDLPIGVKHLNKVKIRIGISKNSTCHCQYGIVL